MFLTILEFLRALLYGIIEGITEWLPISSTGHLILIEGIPALSLGSYLPVDVRDEFCELFNVVIQLGAILAVVIRRRADLFGGFLPKCDILHHGKSKSNSHNNSPSDRIARRATIVLWSKLAAATLPAAVLGLLLDTVTEAICGRDADSLLYTPTVVAAALIIYGVIFILIECGGRLASPRISDILNISHRRAFTIGIFQALSLIPGTSRSGSTVIGARLLGLSRTAATEFSFLMAVPAIAGASALKLADFLRFAVTCGIRLPATAWVTLALAAAVAFFVSQLAIDLLLSFAARHTFLVFGIYRIALGIAVLLLCGR